jgi:propanol-preferring alcohol dehydrogenase
MTLMRAMVFDVARTPLRPALVEVPTPGPQQVLIRVHACAVCRTDLHVVDGELTDAKLPLVPGHEIVGTVEALGTDVQRFAVGDRVGVPWLGGTCGKCRFCLSSRENLCAEARFTGFQIDGGYAEYTVADQRFCFAIPTGYTDIEAAPLLV